jgi:predicted enzyme related to lactoylglutathione lyase
MPGPARAGALIYASDIDRLAAFYERVIGFSRANASAERIVLSSADMQMIIHAMPPHIARTVTIQSPPVQRGSPVRLFFTVSSIAAARSVAAALGGEVFVEQWKGPGFTVCNAMDPEGNIFQVREAAL